MPNHVANRVEFYGEQKNIDTVMNLIKGGDGYPAIDFNKIIPMPENIFRGNLGLEERKLYGENNWYDWSINHWGTKWNAYSQRCGDNLIYFETAWSMPYPIYEKLAEICNEYNVTFSGAWSNEDWSADSGTFDAGDGVFYYYRDDTDEEHLERCKDLWGYDPTEEE